MRDGAVFANKLVPDVDAYGTCYGMRTASVEIQIQDIKGLRDELVKLKSENAQLREWLSWGKYSAR